MKPSQYNNIKIDYTQYLAKGMKILHSPETNGAILAILKGDNPVQLVANATIVVLQKIDTAARAKGIEVQDMVKLLAANEFVSQICEIAEAAKLFTLDDDHRQLALSVAVQDYVRQEIKAGRIDPARLMAQVEQGTRKLSAQQKEEMTQAMNKVQQTALNDQKMAR